MTITRLILQARRWPPGIVEQVASLAGATAIASEGAHRHVLTGAPPLSDARRARLDATCDAARVDWARVGAPPPGGYRVAVMDMDSTLITIECIDEIADLMSIKPAVAAITAAAMRGEIDYPESLRRRVALLAGLDEGALETVYRERLRLSPGADRLIAGLRGAGVRTVLVSGGFTFFTERLRTRLGLDAAHANTLEIEDGRLTGRVVGAIVDGAAKRALLEAECARLGVAPSAALAIGDGANDLAMMRAAGVSVAYRAKPVVRAQATWSVNHNGLDAILPLIGL